MIKVNLENVAYGKKVVLNKIELVFEKGEVNCIIGRNGAGKTTLFEAIIGIKKANGNVKINDIDIRNKNFKSQIFYVPSDFMLPEYLTGTEYMNFIFNVYGKHSEQNKVKLIEIFAFENALNQMIETYSFGMKKKLQIIVAFSLNVDNLIFDEVLSGLDLESRYIFESLVRKYKDTKNIVLSSHEIEFIKKFSNNVYLIENGKVEHQVNLRKIDNIMEARTNSMLEGLV